MLRFLFASLGLIISLAGFLMFLGLGVAIWNAKTEVDRQSAALAGRATDTLDKAGKAIGYVSDIIDTAQSDLKETRKRVANEPPTSIDPFVRLTAERASQDLAGSVDRAHNAVLLASEAVVVADAALNVVDANQELKKTLGLKPGQLDATRTDLGRVASELQQARDVLGIPISISGQPTTEQLQAVDDALHQGKEFTNEVMAVVESTRNKVNDTKHLVDVWAWRAAFATSVLSAFGMVGQIFMGRYFWRCARGADKSGRAGG